MKKITAIVFLLLFVIPSGFAQLKTYSFEQIDSLQRIQNRKVIVFIHTDWCTYCQAMKNTTFKNKEVIKNLNENFYFITLNAEEKRTIIFNSKQFTHNSYGNSIGIHELAYELANINKQTIYPAICVLTPKNEIIFQENNYLPAKQLLVVLDKLKE
jgi:thioredoxin-related protein